MSDPTPENIEKVRANLANMQDLNEAVFTHSLPNLLNAYLLLTDSEENADPGLAAAMAGLEAGFSVLATEAFGPGGTIAAAILTTYLKEWANSPPPSLNKKFASYLKRLEKTSTEMHLQLAKLHQDPAAHWDTPYGFGDKIMRLSDLADCHVPASMEPEFVEMQKATVTQLDKGFWLDLLTSNFVITFFSYPRGPMFFPGTQDKPPLDFAKSVIGASPAFNVTWTFSESTDCITSSGWYVHTFNIGTGVTVWSFNSLNPAACAYLFIDSIPDEVINPDGLFRRAELFANPNIRTETYHMPGAQPFAEEEVSKPYLLAATEGRDLVTLMRTEGRASVEARIHAHARAHPEFALMLSLNPYDTLESFLGIKIPETLTIQTVQEDLRTLGIVIPPINVSLNRIETMGDDLHRE